jgi:hypothetical protein
MSINNKQLLEKSNFLDPKSERSWLRDIAYNNRCILTGLSGDKLQLERHHLYSRAVYPDFFLELLNGVLITKELHRHYHKIYNRSANLQDFLDFIIYLKAKLPAKLNPRLTAVESHLFFFF